MTASISTDSCPHLWKISGWTLDPDSGLWVDPDPTCRKPSPLVLAKLERGAELPTQDPVDLEGCTECGGPLVEPDGSYDVIDDLGMDGIIHTACATKKSVSTLVPTPEDSNPQESTVTTTVARPTTFAEAEVVLAERLPGYESRLQQQALATAIEVAFAEGKHLIAEAGCGTGKSLGGMIPAILSGKRTVVATATIALMEQYANKDVPFLQENLGVPFTWALLKGRSNYLCMAKATNPENVDPALVAALLDEIEKNEDHTGDREHFEAKVTKEEFAKVSMSSAECPGKRECPFGDVCFAEKAKRKAAESQVVITNTAMLMTDLKVREMTDGWGAMLGDYENLLIDEAHELEEIATSQLEETFRPSATNRLVRDAATFATTQSHVLRTQDAVEAAANAVQSVLPDPGKESVRLGTAWFVNNAEPFIALIEALRAMRDEVMDVTIERDEKRQQTKREIILKRIANQVKRYETMILAEDSDLVRWVAMEENPRTRERFPVLHFAPINVGPFLTEWLWNRTTSVLISATMSVGGDFSFIKTRLGLAEAKEINVGTPFDYDTQAMLFVPAPEMPNPKNRSGWLTYAQNATMELISKAGGGALLLFTSRSAMTEAYNNLKPQIEARGFTVLAQGISGTNKEIAATFQADTHSVLFALKSFFTGVDIQGEACRLVIIDKLPFPVPSEPVFQARADEVKRQGKSDFSALSVPMMTLTLTQGYGRLIRTKRDKGVVAILDSRLSSTPWGNRIVDSLPDSPATTSLAEVGAFYGTR